MKGEVKLKKILLGLLVFLGLVGCNQVKEYSHTEVKEAIDQKENLSEEENKAYNQLHPEIIGYFGTEFTVATLNLYDIETEDFLVPEEVIYRINDSKEILEVVVPLTMNERKLNALGLVENLTQFKEELFRTTEELLVLNYDHPYELKITIRDSDGEEWGN